MEERLPADNNNGDGGGRGAVTSLRNRLRIAILSGEIPASAARTQAQLAQTLNVSRTPLREALRMLELEHLIIREPNGRVRAADFSPSEIEQLGIIRLTLDAAAVRLTVPELTAADCARLEGLNAEALRLAEVGEWDDFERAHRDFHALLGQRAGPAHREQLDRLWEQEARYRRAFENSVDADARDAMSLQEHRRILDAAEANDAEKAAALVVEHHARAVREICAEIDADYPVDALGIAVEIAITGRSGPRGTPVRR